MTVIFIRPKTPYLHAALKRLAKLRGTSLNAVCDEKLAAAVREVPEAAEVLRGEDWGNDEGQSTNET